MVLISGTALVVLLTIAAITGGVLISAYKRDAITKGYDSEIALSRDETIEEIMDDASMSDEQRVQLLMKYMGTSAPGFDFGELGKYIPVVVGGYIAAAMLGGKK